MTFSQRNLLLRVRLYQDMLALPRGMSNPPLKRSSFAGYITRDTVMSMEQIKEEAQLWDSTAEAELATRRDTAGAWLAKQVLKRVLKEYLDASVYFISRGAQAPNATYGGSRSMIYYQMMERAGTIPELLQARQDYKACHRSEESNHDELGGILRIAAYRLRNVPVLGPKLEDRVREDNQLMAEAPFDYPEGLVRYNELLDHVPEADER